MHAARRPPSRPMSGRGRTPRHRHVEKVAGGGGGWGGQAVWSVARQKARNGWSHPALVHGELNLHGLTPTRGNSALLRGRVPEFAAFTLRSGPVRTHPCNPMPLKTMQAGFRPRLPISRQKQAAVHCIDESVRCIHLNCPLHTFSDVCNGQVYVCNGQLLVFLFFALIFFSPANRGRAPPLHRLLRGVGPSRAGVRRYLSA